MRSFPARLTACPILLNGKARGNPSIVVSSTGGGLVEGNQSPSVSAATNKWDASSVRAVTYRGSLGGVIPMAFARRWHSFKSGGKSSYNLSICR
jgi:hypothetical protein